MGRILNAAQCEQIKKLRVELESYADKGWMAEGSDAIDGAVGIYFNNDTDESFFYDYKGNVLAPNLNVTSLNDAKKIADIEAAITRVCM